MLLIEEPAASQIRALQSAQSAYYWSVLAPDVFRALGLVSVARKAAFATSPAGVHTRVLLRECPLAEDADPANPLILEAPLHDTAQRRFGRADRERLDVERAVLESPDGREIGTVARQRIRTRNEAKEIRLYEPGDPLWREAAFPIEAWSEDEGEVLAYLRLDSGRTVPGVVRRGPVLVVTFPVFDIVGGWLAFPPLSERYAGTVSGPAPIAAARFILEEIERHHLANAESALVRARAFPEPYTAALSIRHDYDRTISDESWRELMEFYDARGLKASVGILTYLMPPRQIALVESCGHEIQLHCFAHDEYDLREQRELLSGIVSQPLDGVTIHGGPAGIGFRGDMHYAFFERAGFSIAEKYGMRNVPAAPLARIVDGVPRISARLAAPPSHHSLDGSTRPGDHRLDTLRRAIPPLLASGEYVVVMNHPDIHREALYELLDGLDLSNAWTPTVRQAIRFARSTRLGARVRFDCGALTISLGSVLEQPASFEIASPDGSLSTARIDPSTPWVTV